MERAAKLASEDQGPVKLIALVNEIDEPLAKKQDRLNKTISPKRGDPEAKLNLL
jgi:hypothetical protein